MNNYISKNITSVFTINCYQPVDSPLGHTALERHSDQDYYCQFQLSNEVVEHNIPSGSHYSDAIFWKNM